LPPTARGAPLPPPRAGASAEAPPGQAWDMDDGRHPPRHRAPPTPKTVPFAPAASLAQQLLGGPPAFLGLQQPPPHTRLTCLCPASLWCCHSPRAERLAWTKDMAWQWLPSSHACSLSCHDMGYCHEGKRRGYLPHTFFAASTSLCTASPSLPPACLPYLHTAALQTGAGRKEGGSTGSRKSSTQEQEGRDSRSLCALGMEGRTVTPH